MTPTDAEQRFSSLLDAINGVAVHISGVHGAGGPADDLTSYPALTAIKLERQATLNFRGGLALLRDSSVAHGAEILMRSVLEATGQLWRIYGHARGSVAGRRRRALCFEFGSINSLYRATRPRRDRRGRRLPSNRQFTTPEARASIRRRYVDVRRLHQETCPPDCAGVSSSQISEALQNMSKRNRQLRWVFPMWEVASMSSHQTLQRGLASSDPSTLEMLPADLEDRLSYLDRLLVAYGMSIELASEIHKPELKAFRVAVAGIKRELNEIRSLYMSGGTARS